MNIILPHRRKPFQSSGETSYTLIYDSSVAGGSTVNSSLSDFTFYAGHTKFNDISRKIGKITFRLTSVGTVTGKTFVVRIWTSNGSQDCVSNVATSDDVILSGTYTDQEVDFIFSVPFITTAATDYNITVAEKNGTSDASNYMTVHYILLVNALLPAPGSLGYTWLGPNTGSAGQYGIIQPTFIDCIKIFTTL